MGCHWAARFVGLWKVMPAAENICTTVASAKKLLLSDKEALVNELKGAGDVGHNERMGLLNRSCCPQAGTTFMNSARQAMVNIAAVFFQ